MAKRFYKTILSNEVEKGKVLFVDDKNITIKKEDESMEYYYVSMTDRFLSGWGKASGKINKLVLKCCSNDEALLVALNAKDRSEMEDIKIHVNKPSFNTDKFYTTYHGKPDYKRWYSPDRPFKRKD